MATEPSPAIDQTEIFQQLEAYPWDKDAEFQGGLSAILGPNPASQDPAQLTELTLRAQCFYLSRKRNLPINFQAYKNYLSTNTDMHHNTSPNTISKSGNSSEPPEQHSSTTDLNTSSSTPPPPPPHASNSVSFPPSHHSNLESKLSNPSTTHPSTTDLTTDPTTAPPKTAPYPSTFSEIVALITSGAPIPGIRDIPDTLLTDQATKPVASKRRKPWEKDVPETEVEGVVGGTFGDERDGVIVQEVPEGL